MPDVSLKCCRFSCPQDGRLTPRARDGTRAILQAPETNSGPSCLGAFFPGRGSRAVIPQDGTQPSGGQGAQRPSSLVRSAGLPVRHPLLSSTLSRMLVFQVFSWCHWDALLASLEGSSLLPQSETLSTNHQAPLDSGLPSGCSAGVFFLQAVRSAGLSTVRTLPPTPPPPPQVRPGIRETLLGRAPARYWQNGLTSASL